MRTITELTEADWYNIAARSGTTNREKDMLYLAVRLHVLHLHQEHGFGKRKIAKRLGMLMKEVDEILKNEKHYH